MIVIRWMFGAAALLTATPAWAQVCAARKPGWDGLPTPWSVGLVEFLITPLGLALICVACVALMLGRPWLLAAAAGFSLAAAALHWSMVGAEARALGAEGCAPDPVFALAGGAVLAVALGALALWRRRSLRAA